MPRIEVLPNTGSAPAPGWAYIVDTGYDPSKVALNPTNTGKRRARTGGGGGEHGEASAAAVQVRLQKRIALLDSDTSAKDVAVPPRRKDGAFKGGNTPDVRRILLSGKRFDNYLADEEAELRNASAAAPPKPPRSADPSRRVSAAPRTPAAEPMPTDEDRYAPLLASAVPSAPSQEELNALLAAGPLSYNAARVGPLGGPPARMFCAMCGYWGRIRCRKCGERVCRLECKRSHDAVCSQFG